ncbi:MAG: hypothetical protein IJE05_04620 [Clostridia bacterium]|nr:hypothetical protein [Clostridia bacterium]
MKYEENMATMTLEELMKNFRKNVTFVKNGENLNELGIIKWNSEDEEVAYLEKVVSSNETAGLLLENWVEGTKNWSPCDLTKKGFLKDLIEAFFNEESKTAITEEAWTEFPKMLTEAFELIECVS